LKNCDLSRIANFNHIIHQPSQTGGSLRIAYISDLHVDYSPDNGRLPVLLGERLRALSPDVFVLIGDVASRLEITEQSLIEVGELPCPAILVPGNHDIWVSIHEQHEGVNSFQRLDEKLPEICRRHGWHYLEKEPLIVGDTAFVGGMGWYDYSLRNRKRDEEITLSNYHSKVYKRWRWSDQYYAVFLKESGERLSDKAIVELELERLRHQLAVVEQQNARRIVACYHHLPFKALNAPARLPWDFFLAFAGSERFGEILERNSKLAAVLFGHVHLKLVLRTPSDKPLLSSCTGYAKHWSEKSPEKALERSLEILELP